MPATAPTYTPAPLTDRVIAVTPLGHVALTIARLADQLAALDADDRANSLEVLALELGDITPQPAA